MSDETPDEPRGAMRSIRAKISDREPIEESEIVEMGRGPRISWPIAFIIVSILLCVTAVFVMSKWAEWDCKRDGKQWIGSDGIEPDNFCVEPPP